MHAADSPPSAREPGGLFHTASLLLQRRRGIAATAALFFAMAVAQGLLHGRTYTARAAFLPQAAGEPDARLQTLATRLGFSLPVGESDRSPAFHAALLGSNEILRSAVTSSYAGDDAAKGGSARDRTLVEIYRTGGSGPEERIERAVARLRRRLTVDLDRETGVIRFSVRARGADVACQIAARLLELINSFNLEHRQTQAAAERRFVEQRREEAGAELRASEDSLQAFLQQNRRYENSPELRFQYDRLQRRVSLRQEVFVSLAQAYEQARIDEVRNTPVITVIERPRRPARPDRRGLLRRALLGVLLGGAVGAFWAVGGDMLRRARHETPLEYRMFLESRQAAARDVDRIRSGLAGLFRRNASTTPESSAD